MGRLQAVVFGCFAVACTATSSFATECEDAINPRPSERRIDFENCSANILHDRLEYAALSEATDMGGGFVRQVLTDGQYCALVDTNFVIHDCSSGRAAIFGEVRPGFAFYFEGEEPPKYRSVDLYLRVESAAAEGEPLSIDEILGLARETSVSTVVEAKTTGKIAINGHRFPLGCGCKLFYPDSAGAQN
jgi:hypothetical protein